jgi:putative nucleotidyltransferase with HDIG domain
MADDRQAGGRGPGANAVNFGAGESIRGCVILRLRVWASVLAMLVVPAIVLVALRVSSRLDVRFFSPLGHLVAVGGIAGCAAIVAVVAGFDARGATHPGLTYLGIGTGGLALFMLGHGLTTPGILSQPPNPWVGRFPHLAILLFVAALFLAGRPVDSRSARWVARHSATVTAVGYGLVGGVTAVFVTNATALPVPSWEENALDGLSIGAAVLGLGVIVTHWRRYQLGQDPVQLALTFAAAMAIAAVASLQHGIFQQVSWWDYHAYLLAGFGCAAYVLLARARRDRRVRDTLRTALDDDQFAQIINGYPEALLQLVKAVELKDRYTHGHSQRTARIATEIGIAMGLPPDRLRVVARGAYLHDLGKIGVPDHILNKPGRLTAEERAVIERHPKLGYEMAKTAASLHEVLEVILHHHERFDGTGYPAGLAGTDIPLEAAIVAVADVWDALTTDRAYRPGWSGQAALAHISAGRGSHFHPAVVDAMVDLAAGWGITAEDRTSGSPDEAWEAAQTCHQSPDDAPLVGV